MKRKGKFRGHSRLMSIFPINFEFYPERVGSRRYRMKPKGLMDLIAQRERARRMEPEIQAIIDQNRG